MSQRDLHVLLVWLTTLRSDWILHLKLISRGEFELPVAKAKKIIQFELKEDFFGV